jgi:hypothetical protein
VVDGQIGVLRGVYVEDVLALKVIQQPADDPLFVSGDRDRHPVPNAAKTVSPGSGPNYLSGELFFQLESANKFSWSMEMEWLRYTVTDISATRSTADNQEAGTSTCAPEKSNDCAGFQPGLYGKDHVTFQTCIKKGNEWSWGLIFVIATPTQ